MKGKARELKTLGWYFLIALVAELGASFWIWGHSPTHSIRDSYEGVFWAYEIDRLIAWLICFALLAFVRLIRVKPATQF